MKLARYVDRQFASSVLLTIAFYGTLLTLLITSSWWLEEIAAAGFFLFLIWAYRWAIGAKLGLCARRPGALRLEPSVSGLEPPVLPSRGDG